MTTLDTERPDARACRAGWLGASRDLRAALASTQREER